MTGSLADFDLLPRNEQYAFLALFAGALRNWMCFNGTQPTMGKAECEWVEDWREFYSRKLVDLGWLTFEESEPRPALGAAPGSTFTTILVRPTTAGFHVREQYWARMKNGLSADSSGDCSRTTVSSEPKT